MNIPTRRPHPRRPAASGWPAWTDEVRWTIGPNTPCQEILLDLEQEALNLDKIS
ncbi:hypothetical protein [Tautonia plasticadhaerens]|uniref:hypothetical protein n=1 Tax=Tautonia plasticadhaerens TaxID=2527974 RepID=UPI0018D218CD|nr:hypothetical protein [Tautonia plasticadhaerens]